MDVDGFHDVALLDGENDVHTFGDLAEDGEAGCAADIAWEQGLTDDSH